MRDALPNPSFIGFAGTPIDKTDANTRAVFGDYISVYDIQRAVEAMNITMVKKRVIRDYPRAPCAAPLTTKAQAGALTVRKCSNARASGSPAA